MKQQQQDALIEVLRRFFVPWEIYNKDVPMMQKILFGAIGMIIIAVFSAWIGFVVKVR